MRIMFDVYGEPGGERLPASAAYIAFDQTAHGSKLRDYALSLVMTTGPLCPRVITLERTIARLQGREEDAYEKDWEQLIDLGGDFVVEAAKATLLRDGDARPAALSYSPHYSPCSPAYGSQLRVGGFSAFGGMGSLGFGTGGGESSRCEDADNELTQDDYPAKHPYKPSDQSQFLVLEFNSRPIEDFIAGNKRG